MTLTQVATIFFTALVFAIVGTPLAKRLAIHTGVVDMPSGRKVHSQPTPLLGGAAIYGGFLIALLALGKLFFVRELVAILLGATLVSVMGVVDDKWGVRPLIKLAGQCVAGLLVIFTSGTGGLNGGPQAQIFPWQWLNVVVTLIWIVGITNAMNLLDNMDGLSSGVAAVASAYFLLLAALGGQHLVAALSAALLGACIGFLRYNFNPASIFMGDTGSLFLGFMLSMVAIKLRFLGNTPVVTWMVPVIVLGVPIFDTTMVTISRLRRGLNPLTAAGKDHLSHRLVQNGLTRRETVLTCYLLGSTLGMVAIFVSRATVIEAYAVLALLVLAGGYAIYRFDKGFVRP